MVILDYLERLYLAGFILLRIFVSLFPFAVEKLSKGSEAQQSGDPAASGASTMEFLPLMLTSIYCAIGLTWAFLRLSYIYLKPPSRN